MSNIDELKKLKGLLDDGVITQDEFDSQKQKLLTTEEPSSEPKLTPAQPPIKKKGKGCLVILIIVFVFIAITVSQIARDPERYGASTNKLSKEEWLEFDSKSWEDFKILYRSHNNFLKTIDAFSNSKISAVDMYNKCKEAEEYFRKASLSFDYGKTSEQKTYLQAFKSVALSDQMIAKAMMKYLDSKKTSDLSDVKANIENAKSGFVTIAGNRGILLVKAGLTEVEIKEKVEADMTELEKLE